MKLEKEEVRESTQSIAVSSINNIGITNEPEEKKPVPKSSFF
jgi:hypothetical protein